MSILSRLSRQAKTLAQLGPKQSADYLLYQLGLRSGYFTLLTPTLEVNQLIRDDQIQPNWFFNLPDKKQLLHISGSQMDQLTAEVDEILQGKIRFFGGEIKPLDLAPEREPLHWSAYERGSARRTVEDIKYTWEPARFNWAITLSKAYYLNGDERCAAAFWQYFEEFSRFNPVNRGLNWTSAQEVSLRMLALIVSAHLLMDSPQSNPQRMKSLCVSIADHASRIPPTISYAKAQHNNHLFSEAVGLYTAALFLPNHPQAGRWRDKGLRWFNQTVKTQIGVDGTYAQHSTNYHRMMLMLALWMQLLLEKNNRILEDEVLNKLAAASQWLALRLDRSSGQVPNLGHNDGSHVLPLSNAAYNDYRPVVQAASRAFQASAALPAGPWDDLCLWLDIPIQSRANRPPSLAKAQDQLILGSPQNWAALRAVQFTSRPAHADQLHVDIWHHGLNLAMDAGTFQYNAPPPWENALAGTKVHNTLTINGKDQMTRAGKFLWLDWAQAQVQNCTSESITALHNGYRKLGLLHRRTLQKGNSNSWVITDELLPLRESLGEVTAIVNWLVPDWPFEASRDNVSLHSPLGDFSLKFSLIGLASNAFLDIFKAGQSLISAEKDEHLGWYSPTYGVKCPALSIQMKIVQPAPIQVQSIFLLPDESG